MKNFKNKWTRSRHDAHIKYKYMQQQVLNKKVILRIKIVTLV